jgi:hypothetical protein
MLGIAAIFDSPAREDATEIHLVRVEKKGTTRSLSRSAAVIGRLAIVQLGERRLGKVLAIFMLLP